MKFDEMMFKVKELKSFTDDRGTFTPIFQEDNKDFEAVKQVNHVTNPKNYTFRGMHRQHWPYGQMKMVTCVTGKIMDIAYNPGTKEIHAAIITPGSAVTVGHGLYHGYITLEPNTTVMYFSDAKYDPSAEEIVSITDTKLGIKAPIVFHIMDEVKRLTGETIELVDMVIHKKDLITKTK